MANYEVSGDVTELGVAVARRVKAFKGDKTDFNSLGEKLGDTVSEPSGAYSVSTGSWQGKTFVLAIDDEVVPNYDPGAVDWLNPELASAPSFYYNRVLFDAPQAFWQLDDVAPTTIAIDSSQAELNGTYQGGPLLEQVDVPYLNSGKSVQFDGTAQAMVSPSVLSPIAGANFTLEFPFKTSQTGAQVLFASRAFTYPNVNYTVLTINLQNVTPTPGHITLTLADGAVIDTFYTVTPELIADNKWHHIVVIKQGATVQFIYDGKTLAVTGTLTVTGPTHEGSPHVFARAPDSAPGGGLAGLIFAIPVWFSGLTPETAKVHFFLLRRPVQPYTNRIFEDLVDQFHVLEEDAADTVALDLGGFDAHGAYAGGAAPGGPYLCWEETMATSAIINGVGQRINITLPFSESVETSTFTMECWFQTTRTQKSYILDRQANTNRVAIVLNEGAGGVETAGVLQCFISPSPGLVYRVYTTSAHPKIYDGSPHCLGVIYDHPNISIVLDGVEIPTTGTITAATVLNVPLEGYYIGASLALDAATGFVGNISHFSFWEEALPVNTVRAHYQAQEFGYEGTVMNDNPEAYWLLGEAAAPINDNVNNYSNLPVTGTPAYSQPSLLPNDPGNTGIDFNGVAHVTTFSGPLIYNRSTWSLEAWFRIDAWPVTSTVVVGQADSAGNNVAIFVRPTPNRIECGLWDGSSWFLLPLNAELGRLYYIVFTKDAGGLKAYVNGSLYASNPTTNNGDVRTSFTIAFDEAAAGSSIDAQLQHVACYYLSLPQTDIVNHFEVGFHEGVLATIKALSPAGIWPMSDQLNAIQAIDFSGNASHGDYANGALGGGPSQILSEPQQLSANLQAANNSRIQVPALFSGTVDTSSYTLVYFLQTTKTTRSFILDRQGSSGVLIRRAAIELGALKGAQVPNHVQVIHRGDGSAFFVANRAPFDLLTDGTVHCVAVTFDNTVIKIYVDGMELTVDGFMPGPELLYLTGFTYSYFGAKLGLDQPEKFVGDLSFVGFWTNPLAPADIQSIYTAAGYAIPPDDYEAAVLALSPDGFWPCQEKSFSTVAFDVSGNGQDGDYVEASGGGPVLLKNTRDGRSATIGSAQTERIEVPNVFSNPVDAYTFSIWFSTTYSAGRMDLWDNDTVGSSGNQILCSLNVNGGVDTAGYIAVYHEDSTGSWRSTTQAYPQIYDGNPHHLVVIYDETQSPNLILMLDGVELAMTGTLTDLNNLTRGTKMLFGASRYLGGANDGFIGQLAYPALWHNLALSPAQMRHTYLASGAGMDRAGYVTAVLDDAPDSFWEAQEASPATTLIDTSGNGNDGTYNGADGGGTSLIPNRSDFSSVVFTSSNIEQLDVPNGLANPVNSYTFELWFQTSRFDRRMFLWDKEGGAATQRVAVVLNASASNQTLDAGFISLIHTGLSTTDWVSTNVAYPQVYDGKPHHLVITYNEPNFEVVFDGELLPVGNPVTEVDNLNDSANAAIGAHRTDAASGFDGQLSHYSAWFGQALTLTQAQNHYAASGGLPFLERYRLEVLADSPDSFWEMQEASPATTLVDSSGNGNDGSYTAGADGGGTFTLGNEPLSSSADFTATNNALVVPNGFSTTVATTAYTFEFWFRNSNTATRSFLWEKKGGSSFRRVIIILNASVSNVTLDVGKISMIQNNGNPDTWVSTVNAYAEINDGQFHHLAFIYNEPVLQIFLDGVELPVTNDFTPDIGIINDQAEAYIGRHITNTSSQYIGQLSNYAAWFSTSLTPEQVRRHYRAGGGKL